MAITSNQVQALKAELQSWMARNALDGGCEWLTPEEVATRPGFREGSLEFGSPCLLVLIMGKFLYNIMWHVTPDHAGASAFHQLREGFSEIVYRHGFCFDFENAAQSGPGDAMFLKEYYDELSPEERAEEDRKDAELQARIQSYEDSGWTWQDAGRLTDPNDKDVWLMFDPITGEETLSPGYRKRLKEARQERLGEGGDA